MLGFFGKTLEDAPYLIEELVDHLEENTTPVKMAILTSSLRLLFSRPKEMQVCSYLKYFWRYHSNASLQPIVGRVFEKCLNVAEQPDLHDRALLYYRYVAYIGLEFYLITVNRLLAYSANSGDPSWVNTVSNVIGTTGAVSTGCKIRRRRRG